MSFSACPKCSVTNSLTVQGWSRETTYSTCQACGYTDKPELLERLIAAGVAVLNGPDHPVPAFDFWCLAPDVDGYGTDRQTSSLLLKGKRAGRIYLEWSVGPDGERDFKVVRTETFSEPEQIEPGSLVLFPERFRFGPELVGKAEP